MKLSTKSFLIAYCIVLVIMTAITYKIAEDFEPRTIIAQIMIEGIIPFMLFVVLFLFLSFYGFYLVLVESRMLKGIVFMLLNGCLFFLFSFLLALIFRDIGKLKEDKMIYRAVNDSTQKIILQYYETGITGNERYRLIHTSAIHAVFRPIQVIDTQDSIIWLIEENYKNISNTKNIEKTKVPPIEYKNQEYIIEKINQ